MASGWNLWVWLECIGMVSGCCKEAYIYIYMHVDILIILLIPTPLVLYSSIFVAASLLLCSFLKCFFVLVLCYFCAIYM